MNRVDALLIEPLAGLPRKRGVTAAAHAETMDKLRSRLGYMTDDNLRAIHDVILRHAGKGHWPDAALIMAWAYNLQPPPPGESTYARSLMRSAMGRRAADEGWAVELFRVARKLGPPPNRYVITQLVAEADEGRRRRAKIREWIELGKETLEERRWLERWMADLAEVEAIQTDHANAAKQEETGHDDHAAD